MSRIPLYPGMSNAEIFRAAMEMAQTRGKRGTSADCKLEPSPPKAEVVRSNRIGSASLSAVLEALSVSGIPTVSQNHRIAALSARFFGNRRLRRGEPGECWEWHGAANTDGYGRIKVGGVLLTTHRYAYELVNGPIPDGTTASGKRPRAVVMHTCDNPRCCNPTHLRLGTYADNARDMVKKGRNKGFHTSDKPHPRRRVTP